MRAGVVQSRHAFVGGTRFCWWYSEHVGKMTDTRKQKATKSIRNAGQALTNRGEHADRIVGSPSW